MFSRMTDLIYVTVRDCRAESEECWAAWLLSICVVCVALLRCPACTGPARAVKQVCLRPASWLSRSGFAISCS